MMSRLLLCAGLVGALGLAACGKQGTLDRPGPVFGSTRSQARAEREAAARANDQVNHDSAATSQTNGDYTHASDGAKDPALLPFRSNPPQGALNPSGGTGGNGVIPDPFADPNRVPR